MLALVPEVVQPAPEVMEIRYVLELTGLASVVPDVVMRRPAAALIEELM
jgi:hypothetical protein